MKLRLKSKGLIPRLLLYNALVTIVICSILYFGDITWNRLDYQALDFFYRFNIKDSSFLKKTEDVILLNVTSESYRYFGTNILKRESLGEVNNVLAELSPAAVMYDMIFAYPGDEYGDSLFESSLGGLDKIYLPVGISLSEQPTPFKWRDGEFYNRIKNKTGRAPKELNRGTTFYGIRALVQLDRFSEKSANFGHLSVNTDPDGVFRHVPLVIKLDSIVLPSISLTIFLDYLEVPLDSLIIMWGDYVKINKGASRYVEKDIFVPIDRNGQTYIPYPSVWQEFPRMMEAHNLLKYYRDPEMQGDLVTYYEGKFVLIGDVSEGISDLGQTQLEDNVPLVLIHASMLNAFLTDGFFRNLSIYITILSLILIGILFSFATILKSNLPFYITGFLSMISIILIGNYSLQAHLLIPVSTLFIGASTIFLGKLIILQILSNQEQIFIKNAFSKYVPEKVVEKLIDDPAQMKLRGEERLVTILFSDIKDFTKISEKIEPAQLVKLINQYLTEMTKIVLDNGGIIDKYIGDGILAEFGVPIFSDDHAEKALKTALEMQNSIPELNARWKSEGLPEISIRVGVNTGKVIAGNMGSDQVFDYTVLGDAVNLAARLEGANKLYGSGILISEFTLNHIDPANYLIRPLDKLVVKGKSQAVIVYEVYGDGGTLLAEYDKSYLAQFNAAVQLFLAGNYDGCLAELKVIAENQPDDLPTKNLIDKINLLDKN